MKNVFFGLLVITLVFGLVGCDNGNGGDKFVSSTNETTSNDVATLGLIGTSVSSSNSNVATAEITTSGKIKITSVAEGTAVITVTASGNNATINVTVSKTGSITIGTITKYSSSNNGSDNGLPEGLNAGDPDTATLSTFQLTTEVITAVKTAAGGGYEGWILANLENGGTQLQLYWTGRSEAQHSAVVTALRATLNGPADEHGPAETNIENMSSAGTGIMVGANGSYSSAEWRYSTMYAKTACIIPEWDINMPAGNLVINFWEED
jgi:hypothetical protein